MLLYFKYCICQWTVTVTVCSNSLKMGGIRYFEYLFWSGNREFWSQNVFLKCNFFEFTMDFINPELSIIDRNIKRSSESLRLSLLRDSDFKSDFDVKLQMYIHSSQFCDSQIPCKPCLNICPQCQVQSKVHIITICKKKCPETSIWQRPVEITVKKLCDKPLSRFVFKIILFVLSFY